MSFSLDALVDNPDPALVKALRDRVPHLVHVARNGTLVVHLDADYDLSPATYPGEYRVVNPEAKSGLFRFSRDFSQGPVHEIHAFPEELAGTPYRLVLENPEAHLSSYCLVTTGYDGERIHPYRRESSANGHHSVSVFSAPAMGSVRIDFERSRNRGILTIRRAKVEVIDGLVTVVTEQLFRKGGPQLLTHRVTLAPTPDLTAWEPALRALYERFECRNGFCQGHYHLD